MQVKNYDSMQPLEGNKNWKHKKWKIITFSSWLSSH